MSRLNKDLSLLQGTALLCTSLLGTGIFVVPALAATAAGPASLWAWLILIALVLPIAFTFARLGRQSAHAGGAPHLIGLAFGPRMERVSAWLFLAVVPVGIPAALHIASGFWVAALPLVGFQVIIIQLGTLLLILLLGLRPARASGFLQIVIALAVITTVALIWWAGDLPHPDQPLLPSLDAHGWQLIPAALGVMFWCFVGIEAFTHMGEEFRNPQRDYPIALLLGVLLAGLVYWACSVAILSFGTYGDVNEDVAALPVILSRLLGAKAGWIAVIVGYLACFASMNIYIQGFARLIWSLADEGKLPGVLASRNHHGVPATALIVVVSFVALCALASHLFNLTVDDLIRYANGNFVLIYLFSMAAGCRLLHGKSRLLAWLSTLLCGLVLLMLGTDALYALILLLCLLIIDLLLHRDSSPP